MIFLVFQVLATWKEKGEVYSFKSITLAPKEIMAIIHTSSTGSGKCPDSSITIGTSCELWLSFKSGFGLVGAMDPPERKLKKS